jgi:hypothetical protein
MRQAISPRLAIRIFEKSWFLTTSFSLGQTR